MPPSEPNIPHLFIDSSTEENVLTWEAAINENPAVYQNCFVRRITHVKDLNNRVLHEYLQVIVEDKSSKFCTRLIAERLQQRDQVTIGRWKPFDHYQEKWSPEDCYYHPLELAATSEISSSGSSSSKSLEVLPLPLLTRSLPKDDLSVQRFANILGKAHWEHPDYNFIVYNCYWFSECVYEGVRAFQPTLKDHVWKYSWLKRKLWFISGAMKRAAERFLELQKHVPIGAPGNEPKVPSDEYYIKSLDEVIHLAQEDASKSPTEASSMTEEEIEQAKTKYHDSISLFIEGAHTRDNWEAFRDLGRAVAYKTGWQPQSTDPEQSVFGSSIHIEEPTEEEYDALDQAVFSFIGRLYEDYGNSL